MKSAALHCSVHQAAGSTGLRCALQFLVVAIPSLPDIQSSEVVTMPSYFQPSQPAEPGTTSTGLASHASGFLMSTQLMSKMTVPSGFQVRTTSLKVPSPVLQPLYLSCVMDLPSLINWR